MAYEIFYKYLFPLLSDTDLSFLRLFKYITFRASYALVSALALSLIFGPYLIRYLKRRNAKQPIRDDGPKTHKTKSSTPTMGGVLIVGSILISTLFWGRLDFTYIILLLFVVVAFGLIGFIDDYKKLSLKSSKGLSAYLKLFLQIVVSVICMFVITEISLKELANTLPKHISDYISKGHYLNYEELSYFAKKPILPLYIPFIDNHILDMYKYTFSIILPILDTPIVIPYLYIIFGSFVIAASSNAVNLTDGLDGLAIGLVIFVGIAFGILSYLSGNVNITQYLNIAYISQGGELSVFTTAFVGGCIGFLWYNCHPAQIFMGDTGSLSLGGVVGVLAVILKKEFLLIIIGGVFVLELLSVILQVLYYKCTKKRIFKMAPIHHHFELSGWAESQVIIRFWIIGIILGLIGLSTLKLQ